MYGLVTLLPLCSVILQRSGFHAGESQLLMIFMVGITLTGLLSEVSQINDATQFLGTFGLLVGMYILGLLNELM